jgi:RecA/RadA recombinase
MAESEKRKKLLESVAKFNKQEKGKVVDFANNIDDYGVIPSGVEEFDKFIGGGFKQGAHSILWGGYSVGKTAMALTTIANAQKLGKTCCYVNLEKPIDTERFEWFGINLDEMLYIEAPNDAEQALEALRTFSQDKVIDLFIIDSIQGMCPRTVKENKGKQRGLEERNVASLARVLSNFYNVVNADIFKAKAAVIWIGQTRTEGIGSYITKAGLTGGAAQKFYAFQMVFMRQGQKADAPVVPKKIFYIDPNGKERYKTEKVEIGFDVVLRMDKTNSSKSERQNATLHLPYFDDSGFFAPKSDVETELETVEEIEKEIEFSEEKKEKDIIEETTEKPKTKRRGRPKKDKNDS